MTCKYCGKESHIDLCLKCLNKIIDKLTPEQMDECCRLIIRLRESEK